MNNTLQEVLHSEIPLTKEIGITVSEYTGDSLTLQAPLENNLNHKCTAFGGSIYSVSVLSGWGLLYLLLKEHDLVGHIVIQESNTKFLKPVEYDLSARCSFESIEQKDKFIRMFKRKGVARIQLESRIKFDNDNHVIFNGAYVVHT
ncbi:MAG: hypothetical protein DHS20C09_04070 [marine bacterium B5-7]|nr:MAG: hypothetical protein DHS20C09_04070 [marine bacterium B5-7]